MSYDPTDFQLGWNHVAAGGVVWLVLLAGIAALGPALEPSHAPPGGADAATQEADTACWVSEVGKALRLSQGRAS
ncbi:hypothetical protein SLNSH_04510 [Alsobacter soli]|uniref:Uncharacterized protein n=1 Tax=Alsobacter soli TaxID=2109933 RepID=A0A2T1HWU4_9HYPH|nr:hypothetical protein [Alsobacter soli]PSC06075.1 hypothetical protein SLNSH_04510 [Alsobacter soli]